MSHPLVMVNGPDWKLFLKHFKDTMSFLALHDGKSQEEVDAFIETYAKNIEDNREDIFVLSAHDMVKYLNFYNIRPREAVYDEFKGIYFIGMAVSKYLLQLGLADLNRLHLRAMLRLLDFRLDQPYKVRRKALSERIQSVIDNNAVDEHLGKYGWYLVYKCLYNAANENSKTV